MVGKSIEYNTMMELTGECRACIPVGPTRTWDGLLNWTKCVWKVEKKNRIIGKNFCTSVISNAETLHSLAQCTIRISDRTVVKGKVDFLAIDDDGVVLIKPKSFQINCLQQVATIFKNN